MEKECPFTHLPPPEFQFRKRIGFGSITLWEWDRL